MQRVTAAVMAAVLATNEPSPVATALTKLYGTWAGTVVLEDGSTLNLHGLLGAAECKLQQEVVMRVDNGACAHE